jgi:hypothetical protein
MADEFTKAALYWIKTFNKKVKEKIWMGKLVELLNEYDPYIASDGEHRDNLWGYAYQWHSAVFPKELAESYIISARYGFIKWLVENDKIDKENVYNNSDYPMVKRDEFLYEWLLMLLAIQDEPVKYLCEILR